MASPPAPHPEGTVPALPGAVGISALTVYADGSVDGHAGGSAHVHLVCSEAYYVMSGTGAVQTLGSQGFEETPLHPGVVLQFGPGTIHRLVTDGDLRILVIMQNAGLPEAGDAVLALPAEHLASAERYAAATVLGRENPNEQASARRDLSVAGFTQLRDAYASRGAAALEPFYAAAASLVRPHLEEWRSRWHAGARRAAADTARQLDALAAGDLRYLHETALVVQPEPAERDRLGMCGHLDTYAATAPR